MQIRSGSRARSGQRRRPAATWSRQRCSRDAALASILERNTTAGGGGNGLPGVSRSAAKGRWLGMFCLAVAIALALINVIEAPMPSSAATSPNWTVSKQYPPVAFEVNDVSCVSLMDCVAVSQTDTNQGQVPAGVILHTTDGGSTWHTQSMLAGVRTLTGIACVSATTCETVGTSSPAAKGVVFGTTDAGATWHAQVLPSGVHQLNGISCTSAAKCIAVGGCAYTGALRCGAGEPAVIIATTDGGARWTSQGVPTGIRQLNGVACASAVVCEAVGRAGSSVAPRKGIILGTSNGGMTWNAQSVPGGIQELTSVACPSVTRCEAVGDTSLSVVASSGAVVGTTDAGTIWSVQQTPSDVGGLYGIACPSVTRCVATAIGKIGGPVLAAITTTDGGTTWTARTASNRYSFYPSTGLACPSVTTCVAAGENVSFDSALMAKTTNGGAAWSAIPIPAGVISLSGIACSSGSTCEAVGSTDNGYVIVGTSDGGATWRTQRRTTGLLMLTGISCPSVTTCMVVGELDSVQGGTILATNDGGARWNTLTPPAGVGGLDGVACPTTNICLVVGDGSVDAGTIYITTDGGATWTASTPSAFGGGFATAVACSSAQVCEVAGTAIGPAILGTTDGGTTWVSQRIKGQVQEISGISCPATSTCEAIDPFLDTAYRTTDGGAIWKLQHHFSGSPSAVTCSTAEICEVTTGTVFGTIDGGTSWASQPLPTGAAQGISCPTADVCYAVGSDSGTGVVFKREENSDSPALGH